MTGEAIADEATAERLAQLVIERTIALAEIPAPTGEELDRADLVTKWWVQDGISDVAIDEVGNVWGCAVTGGGPAIVVAAHLDTVFSRDVDHTARREGTRLVGPGVGDNSIGVAALSIVGVLVAGAITSRPVWLLATVAEEGLGNLRGINWALEHSPCSVGALVALEGNYLGRISTTGVGSVRWSVQVSGPGGHAWEAATAPSAVSTAAKIVAALSLVVVESGRRSVNVGMFSGGEAINARARHATFVVDLRAVSPDELDAMVVECREIVAAYRGEGVDVVIEEIGTRPAGLIDESHALVRAARAAHERHGVTARLIASSTDANAAHPRGVPALALGVTYGAAEHTTQEWIELDPVARGLRILADTVIDYIDEVENV